MPHTTPESANAPHASIAAAYRSGCADGGGDMLALLMQHAPLTDRARAEAAKYLGQQRQAAGPLALFPQPTPAV